jgi:dual 3',5'-cyclic-AMP and -GMP phosphodiesterase 11
MNERDLIFELVKDICNDLDIQSLCHKILQNVGMLLKADRASLFLVQGEKDSRERCLVTKLFDVCSSSTVEEIKTREEIHVPWGMGIVGFVAETGRSVNVPDAYMVSYI